MAKKQRIVDSAWSKRADKAVRGVRREGALYELTGDAKEVLLKANKYGLLSKDAVGNRVADTVSGTRRSGENFSRDFTGTVALPRSGSETIEVSVSTDTDQFYIIDANGVVIANNGTLTPLEPGVDDDELKLVKFVLEQSVYKLNAGITRKEDYRKWRTQALVRRWRVTAIVVASVGLAGGGITLGVYKWHVVPSRAATAYAHVYDAQHHNLPGEGAPVATYPFAMISADDFEAIPELRRKDTSLESPRRVFLSYEDGCTTIYVDTPKGVKLRAAMAEGSSVYMANGYNVTKDSDSVELCLANYDESSSDRNLPVAVQVVAP